jgi:hypothetical protein
MGKIKEVSLEAMVETIGDGLHDLNQYYITEYVKFASPELLSPVINLKIIKNSDGSFSVYDAGKDLLINAIRKVGRNKFIVIPMALARELNRLVFQQYFEEHGDKNFKNSVYSMLYDAFDQPLNERIDEFLFYIGGIVVDAYQLDPHKSLYGPDDLDNILLDCCKMEWTVEDKKTQKGIDHQDVAYIIEAFSKRDHIIVSKVYSSMFKNDELKVTIEEIIKKAVDEFKGFKNKKF